MVLRGMEEMLEWDRDLNNEAKVNVSRCSG